MPEIHPQNKINNIKLYSEIKLLRTEHHQNSLRLDKILS